MSVQALNKIKQTLIEEGWTQGAYHRQGHGYCLVGAAMECIPNPKEYINTLDSIRDTIGANFTRQYSLTQFNDSVAKSANDIFDLIDRTIQRIQGEPTQ